MSLQDQFNVEQEQEDIDRAIALEALSLKRQERNNKAIGLYLEEQEELEKSAKRQSNLMQVIKKSEIEEIKVLEQQKINKFLNLFIKLVTFGKINKNKKIELEISKKWKKISESCSKKPKTNPTLFSKSSGKAFNKQQVNNDSTNAPLTNLNKPRTSQM
ncbi:hypothetical protein [Spiroplasma endosymbiont of Panzeria rudis]|uniref:hypothetical protein n=1 Tax=Spiroplasma endosymbiont of Panzeria rudis TaxID=3066301 RepID=UPI0030D28B1D